MNEEKTELDIWGYPKLIDAVRPARLLNNLIKFADVAKFAQEVREQDKINEVTALPLEVDSTKGFISALANVGVIPDDVKVVPREGPHNRDFSVLETVGVCRYEDEVIEAWDCPDMGAVRVTKDMLSSISVLTDAGVVGPKQAQFVIECAREKLDGIEGVVFGIKTQTKTQYFSWFGRDLRKDDSTSVGHYERVGEIEYCLSGINARSAIPHEWSLLTSQLCQNVKEGIILLIGGVEYRVPRIHTATFQVIDSCVKDLEGDVWGLVELPDGLYDFRVDDEGFHEMVKSRCDKYRPDSQHSIKIMLKRSVNMEQFLKWVRLPLYSSADCDKIVDKFRTGKFGRYKRGNDVRPTRSVFSQFNVSGRVISIPQPVKDFKLGDAYYGPFGVGEIVRIRLKKMDYSRVNRWKGISWYLVRKIPMDRLTVMGMGDVFIVLTVILLGESVNLDSCGTDLKDVIPLLPPVGVVLDLLDKGWFRLTERSVNMILDVLEIPEACTKVRCAMIGEVFVRDPCVVVNVMKRRSFLTPHGEHLKDFITTKL